MTSAAVSVVSRIPARPFSAIRSPARYRFRWGWRDPRVSSGQRRPGAFTDSGTAVDAFDPLELDRFSNMQQLSRGMLEGLHDLDNLGEVLDGLIKETETLLLQQSRVSTDLQDGLLRTRMVPFSQLVPRLHRVVRQTAGSLGKEAKFEVYGAEGELDRGILDRMIESGWIRKERDPDDGRVFRIFTTKKAAKAREELIDLRIKANEQLLSGFTREERVLFKRLLRDLS